MFRLQMGNLPKDPTYPAHLKELGFFVNSAGQFRMKDYPDKDFQFHYSNNERHNEVRREAFQICQRAEVDRRLDGLGFKKLYLPQLSYSQPIPDREASVPILAPPAEVLKTRKRVIVLINDIIQDLGILAYRQLQRDRGADGGSVINFVREVIDRSLAKEIPDYESNTNGQHQKSGAELPKEPRTANIEEDSAGEEFKEPKSIIPGFVVMNCGQLLYSYKLGRALTMKSWLALPRASAIHEAIEITEDNHIEGNYDAKEHVRFILDNVINNKDFVAKDAEVYVIAIESGAENILDILDSDWDKYGSRITALALVNSLTTNARFHNPHLKAFLHQRTRQWNVSNISEDPRECIGAPSQYAQEVEILDSSSKDKTELPNGHSKLASISWLDEVPAKNIVSKAAETLQTLTISAQPAEEQSLELADANGVDTSPICPSFPDCENPFSAGECVFTAPPVQQAILDFFEEVAQNPTGYRNPVFDPREMPKEVVADLENLDFESVKTPEMMAEQLQLHEMKEELEKMKAALRDTPTDNLDVFLGRASLEKRIAQREVDIEELAKKTLATGGMKAGEAEDLRQNWTQVGGGPKIPFAGTMVDSELVRGAGLDETADEAEEELLRRAGSGLSQG